ncbi:MAG: c-type cytochrome [Planctomycetota bacterium]|nr:c-type cytochrome [Planctomycetota bacterium]
MNTNVQIQMSTCHMLKIFLICGIAFSLRFFLPCQVQSVAASEPTDSPSKPATSALEYHPDLDCPEGFVLEAVADDKWVHDAFSMTTDSRGNVVVSGPGYIRTLTDLDASGRFTRAIDLKATINQGAHGLWCEVGKYYFVADGGLWVVSDANGDCVADGPRKKMLDLPTGGEHDAHAIRRGPDGWWYLIVGNFASTIGKLRNDPDSPVPQPRAGTLWRISPDFSKRGVWAHGLRNAYDFDFLADGSIVTYDSDEERELTLPWYRQTRVVVLSAGSDAGWLNSAWADLASRSTMPHTLSGLGRGSPTGVKVYDHTSFPQKYHNAIFVQDWTFGRILAIYPQPKDATDADQVPERLMAETVIQTNGKVGFAPTDITVAPDGSLLICSGGRGTTGALYRLRYNSTGTDADSSNTKNSDTKNSEVVATIAGNEAPLVSKQTAKQSATLSSTETLVSCLSAPSPLEAWSRAQWEPIWRRASKEARSNAISNSMSFQSAAFNSLSVAYPAAYSLQRRAIQCEVDLQSRGAFAVDQRVSLTEFQKLCLASNAIHSQATTSASESFPPASTRQTAWWALGHLPVPATQFNAWMQTLNSVDPSQSTKNFDSTLSVPIEAIIGDPVIRAFYECIGLHRGSLPSKGIWETHRAAISGKDARTAETQRTVRQVQLWAASRTNAITQATSSADLALDTRAFDASVGRRLFGPNSNAIDASLLDQLAHRCSKKLITFTSPEVLEALAILQTSLGDYRFAMPAHQAPPTSEVIDGYRCLYGSKIPDAIRENWSRWCMIIAESQTSESWKAIVVPEALRALAMLTPKSPAAVTFCLEQITPSSHPTSDIHALITLSCCNAPRASEQTLATGDALAGLLGKVKSLAMNTESKWAARLGEIWKRLVEKDPQLPSLFASREKFGTSDDLFWVKLCPEQSQSTGQSRFKQALLRTPLKDWEADVARYVWSNPKQVTPEVYEYIRKQCAGQSEPHSALTIELLSSNPSKVDYDTFLSAIESNDRSCLANAWNGLSLLPVEEPDREMIAVARLWSVQNQSNLPEVKLNTIAKRIRMVATKAKADQVSKVKDNSGELVTDKSKSDSETDATKTVLPSSDSWNDWEPYLKTVLGDRFPESKAMADATDVSLPKEWQDRVKAIDKLVGDVDRGRLIYQASKCASCHGGENANTANALGPSLTGVAKRFSAEDLFRAIFEPSRDISDRYRATKVLTTDGTIFVGMKIYDSVDGITLQLADGMLARVNQADIEEKAFSDQSIMPAGLVDAKSPKELADLYAYLKGL